MERVGDGGQAGARSDATPPATQGSVASTPHEDTGPGAVLLDEGIRRRAYELYLARGGRDGSDVDDWLTAEREIRLAGVGAGVADRRTDGPADDRGTLSSRGESSELPGSRHAAARPPRRTRGHRESSAPEGAPG
jgi:hypothetical protein